MIYTPAKSVSFWAFGRFAGGAGQISGRAAAWLRARPRVGRSAGAARGWVGRRAGWRHDSTGWRCGAALWHRSDGPTAAPSAAEWSCKVGATAKTCRPLACVEFDFSCPTLWQGPNPPANFLLLLNHQPCGTTVNCFQLINDYIIIRNAQYAF